MKNTTMTIEEFMELKEQARAKRADKTVKDKRKKVASCISEYRHEKRLLKASEDRRELMEARKQY